MLGIMDPAPGPKARDVQFSRKSASFSAATGGCTVPLFSDEASVSDDGEVLLISPPRAALKLSLGPIANLPPLDSPDTHAARKAAATTHAPIYLKAPWAQSSSAASARQQQPVARPQPVIEQPVVEFDEFQVLASTTTGEHEEQVEATATTVPFIPQHAMLAPLLPQFLAPSEGVGAFHGLLGISDRSAYAGVAPSPPATMENTISEPVKRKRGRPRKNPFPVGAAGSGIPNVADVTPNDASMRKKRARTESATTSSRSVSPTLRARARSEPASEAEDVDEPLAPVRMLPAATVVAMMNDVSAVDPDNVRGLADEWRDEWAGELQIVPNTVCLLDPVVSEIAKAQVALTVHSHARNAPFIRGVVPTDAHVSTLSGALPSPYDMDDVDCAWLDNYVITRAAHTCEGGGQITLQPETSELVVASTTNVVEHVSTTNVVEHASGGEDGKAAVERTLNSTIVADVFAAVTAADVVPSIANVAHPPVQQNTAPIGPRRALSADEFEQLMWLYEREAWRGMLVELAGCDGLANLDEDALCDVCRLGDTEDSNAILFCDGCDVAVHQACYGIDLIPEGTWFCGPCAAKERNAPCVLCPNRGGALKPVKSSGRASSQRWAHVSCALWIPEVGIEDADKMEPVVHVERVPAARRKLRCCACNRTGPCIQCSVRSCRTAFHITCAQASGLTMLVRETPNGLVHHEAYCERHGMGATGSTSARAASGAEKVALLRRIQENFFTHAKPAVAAEIAGCSLEDARAVWAYWVLKRQSRGGTALMRQFSDLVQLKRKGKGPCASLRHCADVVPEDAFRADLCGALKLCGMVVEREKMKLDRVRALAAEMDCRLRAEGLDGLGGDWAPFRTTVECAASTVNNAGPILPDVTSAGVAGDGVEDSLREVPYVRSEGPVPMEGTDGENEVVDEPFPCLPGFENADVSVLGVCVDVAVETALCVADSESSCAAEGGSASSPQLVCVEETHASTGGASPSSQTPTSSRVSAL